jgi:hypothetical protein
VCGFTARAATHPVSHVHPFLATPPSSVDVR